MITKIAIIGTGISAAYLAYRLSSIGRKAQGEANRNKEYIISLFDKARGIGGRTASKRVEETSFDYGASFFQIDDLLLEKLLSSGDFQDCLELSLRKVTEIDLSLDLASPKLNEHSENLYSSKPYGNSFTKSLLKELKEIHLEKRITEVKMNTDKTFKLRTSDGIWLDNNFDMVISTAPAPQSAEIFSAFPDLTAQLKEVNYACNYMLLVSLSEFPKFNEAHKALWESDLIRVNNSIISEIRLNHRKEARNKSKAAFIIEANPEFSSMNLNTDKGFIESQILNEFKKIYTDYLKIDYTYLHRWLYSKPLGSNKAQQHSEKAFLQSKLGNVFAIGDYCKGLSSSNLQSGSRSLIESALISAEELYSSITQS